MTIDPLADKVEYEGKIVSPARPNAYLAYHKPRGVIVTAFDPQGRETVYDALAEAGVDTEGMRYVGRLDYNSEGLLLLTNDGNLVHALTHPRYHVKKVYEVCVTPVLTLADARKMTDEGIVSEDQLLRAGAVRALQVRTAEGHWYSVDLYEGKKRQLRRIFEALGYTVARLKRVQFASVKLGDLAEGKARSLSEREIAALLSAGHSPPPRK
jgi:23S rRNA pseudouridine2605 synthase